MIKEITRELDVMQNIGPMDSPEDTHVTIAVDTQKPWIDSMRVALLELASQKAHFVGMGNFEDFIGTLGKDKFDVLNFIDVWRSELGDRSKAIKYVVNSPKKVSGMPPLSHCPRCGVNIWEDATISIDDVTKKETPMDAVYFENLAKNYHDYRHPFYCLSCGQLFKWEAGGLPYDGWSNKENIEKYLAVNQRYVQPSLESVDD